MSRNQIYLKLVEICANACSFDLLNEEDEISKYDLLSSDLIDMAISIELQLGIVFGDDVIFSWRTFTDIVNSIEKEMKCV